MKFKWKTIALIFITLFVLETLWMAYGYHLVTEQEDNTLSCYYEVCSDYPEAEYDVLTSVCTCYDYDLMGAYVVARQELIK